MSGRHLLYVVAVVLAGVAILIVGTTTIVFLDYGDCSAAFSYYGCETPVANVRTEGDQSAQPQVGMRLGLRARQ